MATINRFKGQCSCGRNVPAGYGTLIKLNHKLHVRCMDCTRPRRADDEGTGEACDAVFDRNLVRFGHR